MPARRKTLEDLVADRSFLARRHADRLLEAPLARADLQALQASYRGERDEDVRTAIATAFERSVQKSSNERRKLSSSEFFYAGLGPGMIDADDLGFRRRREDSIDWAGFDRLSRRWKWWNGRHGTWWRVKHRCMHNHDALKLYRLLSGTTTRRVDVADDELRAHLIELDQLIVEREPIPDPPGWDRL